MLRIAICDDEQFYRDKIKRLLEKYLKEHDLNCEIHLFSSGKEFLDKSENSVKYDIVFMDINMEEMDGIQTAMQMRAFHSETYLVLITAFINYVLEGYKVDAVRYIMKDTLDAALPECMAAILQKMKIARVSFSFMEGERMLYADNLFYVESQRHKLIFYYMEEQTHRDTVRYHMYEKLDTIEQKLHGYGFLRIHKSYLVNMKHIRRIGNYTAVLSTGEELPVPRLRFQAVREEFVAYKGAM
ncbi:transcriptional regulatory protein YpdB [Lachnospiraceae bacterium]|nr:response regulator transcription factor [Lachnospiraceae bacterium]GFI02410.1 transcriptional regulatory protein YpdB [Lachnospiraceae bacterium]GFI08582.1 transcriptional regulatory protein YpdB [Lachnospiraceae bacterium]